MSDTAIFLLIYMVGFLELAFYALKYKPFSDRLGEYKAYLNTFKTNKIIDNRNEVLSSCLTAIILPYLISKYLHLSRDITFKITPCFLYALMPSFCYLISREYLSIGDSLIVSAFVFSNMYFAYYPNLGRVSIAWGLLSGLIWALLTSHPLVVIIFVSLLVVSHYGTAHYALFVFGGTWAVLFFAGNRGSEYIIISTVMVTLATAIWVWFGFFATTSGGVTNRFIHNSVTLKSSGSLLSIDSRENVVQTAFGKNFKQRKFPQYVEFFVCWITVILVSMGLILFLVDGQLSVLHRLLAVFSYLAIILTLVIPHISVYYGIARVYFTSLVILAPCFMYGVDAIAVLLGINGYVLGISVVAMYYLCTSGILHRIFGIDKRAFIKQRITEIWG